MKKIALNALVVLIVLAMVGCTAAPVGPAPVEPTTVKVAASSTPAPSTSTAVEPSTETAQHLQVPSQSPFDLISQESLLAFTADLTAIQPYSGWRNSATQGESEALDYVAGKLGELDYLQGLGLELERQNFRVFMTTEQWESRLDLRLDGQDYSLPASGLRGHRDIIQLALNFDSDGSLNDTEPDPVVVEGPVALVQDAGALQAAELQGKVVFLDFEVVDQVLRDRNVAIQRANDLLAKRPAGVVVVTRFSNKPGESHGTFLLEGGAFTLAQNPARVPLIAVRLEDMATAGVQSWQDLAKVQSARMIWDADVLSPAESGNLVAHIPGVDSSRAMILSGHIDSPNNPGALDDGSGSVVLLETARVLNAARTQPPVDLYLVWFGSEELGLYGSAHFVASHQELLDRTIAMLQTDDLTRPLDGLSADLMLITWSTDTLGGGGPLWNEYLSAVAADQGVQTVPIDLPELFSDNNSFAGFAIPHADQIYMDESSMGRYGVYYSGHIHDPYDTVDLVRDVVDVLAQMVKVALSAALQPPTDVMNLHGFPKPERRAVFVASHTEEGFMTPTNFSELGMALALQGFDVDLVPYGQPLSAQDLLGADLVFALPVIDYPSPDGDPTLYDESWSSGEIDALQAYVEQGGLLVLANSAKRTKFVGQIWDSNEDSLDVNDLSSRFGITYLDELILRETAFPQGEHPLISGVNSIQLGMRSGVPFRIESGQVLFQTPDDQAVIALTDYGPNGGQVLAIADIVLFDRINAQATNLPFWKNLAAFAASR